MMFQGRFYVGERHTEKTFIAGVTNGRLVQTPMETKTFIRSVDEPGLTTDEEDESTDDDQDQPTGPGDYTDTGCIN